MILFLYLFIIDYLLVVRAAAFCICQALFATTFSPGRPGWLPFSSFCAVSISWQKQ